MCRSIDGRQGGFGRPAFGYQFGAFPVNFTPIRSLSDWHNPLGAGKRRVRCGPLDPAELYERIAGVHLRRHDLRRFKRHANCLACLRKSSRAFWSLHLWLWQSLPAPRSSVNRALQTYNERFPIVPRHPRRVPRWPDFAKRSSEAIARPCRSSGQKWKRMERLRLNQSQMTNTIRW
jgi:hypothetical protein